MNIEDQIKEYLNSQPEPKRGEMETLHTRILRAMPQCKLWFLDGKDGKGKIVTNPNIGYGLQNIKYSGGKTKSFIKSVSAQTRGNFGFILSVSLIKYLAEMYGKKIGKASVTGYCIKFKTLEDINIDILEAAIRFGVEQTGSDK